MNFVLHQLYILICKSYFYKGSNGNLGDNLLGGSWHIGGDFCLPISSPSFEGHTAAVRLELNKENGISLKLFLESKLALPCFGVSLR